MNSKFYIDDSFDLTKLQALQSWADNNLLIQPKDSYYLYIGDNEDSSMYAETEILGLTAGEYYLMNVDIVDFAGNDLKIRINELSNDNTFTVYEMDATVGKNQLPFQALASNMYLAIGDDVSNPSNYIHVDSVVCTINGTNAVENGDFETGDTTGWYSQGGSSQIEVREYEVSDNPYLVDVSPYLPPYDSGDPSHFLISDSGDWTESNLNNPDYQHFYIEPGTYTSKIEISTSGTDTARRTISLYNGNDTHPGKLDKSQLANMAFELTANYWVFDRIATFDVNIDYSFELNIDSSNLIFNRMFANNVWSAMIVKHACHNVTIQNGRFDTMTHSGFEDDVAMINVVSQGEDNRSPFEVYDYINTNNEYVDCKPTRANRYPGDQEDHGQYANFDGYTFAYNTVEFTTEKRTDGNGNYTPDGDYYAGEAVGLTMKSGSLDENKPVVISHNIIWGYRPSDSTMGNLSSPGGGFGAYYGSKYVHIFNNIVFDGTRGLMLSDRVDEPYGTQYAEIHDNLIVDSGGRPGATQYASIFMNQAKDADVRNNTVIRPIGYDVSYTWNYSPNYVGQNIFAGGDQMGFKIEDNADPEGLDTNVFYTSEEEGGYIYDYTFTTDNYTNNPKSVTIEKVLKAPQIRRK